MSFAKVKQILNYRKMSFITNVKDYYLEEGLEVYPYSQEDVKESSERLGGFPELLKEYLLIIGRVEEESQFEKSILKLEDWSFDKEDISFGR